MYESTLVSINQEDSANCRSGVRTAGRGLIRILDLGG